MNWNMPYDFNITIARVQCKPKGSESYEGGFGVARWQVGSS